MKSLITGHHERCILSFWLHTNTIIPHITHTCSLVMHHGNTRKPSPSAIAGAADERGRAKSEVRVDWSLCGVNWVLWSRVAHISSCSNWCSCSFSLLLSPCSCHVYHHMSTAMGTSQASFEGQHPIHWLPIVTNDQTPTTNSHKTIDDTSAQFSLPKKASKATSLCWILPMVICWSNIVGATVRAW